MRAHPQERKSVHSAQISTANAVLQMLHNQGRYACGRKYGCELSTRVQHYDTCDSRQGSGSALDALQTVPQALLKLILTSTLYTSCDFPIILMYSRNLGWR